MKKIITLLLILNYLGFTNLHSQKINFDIKKLQAVGVFMSAEKYEGRKVLKVIKDSSITKVDEPTFVKFDNINFKNGSIEVMVLSKLLPNAPELARGFIGVAFRVNENNTKFECIYIRPTNGRADNQLRRNRSTQYFSFPDYKFDRLRKEAPGEYESYADMGLNEWIKLKITVKDSQARLFINNNPQPSLVISELKPGGNSSGSIGLWVDVGTEGYFSNLIINKEN